MIILGTIVFLTGIMLIAVSFKFQDGHLSHVSDRLASNYPKISEDGRLSYRLNSDKTKNLHLAYLVTTSLGVALIFMGVVVLALGLL